MLRVASATSLIFLALSAAGCASSDVEGPANWFEDTSDASIDFDLGRGCVVDPSDDSDGDGLSNATEDSNRDCVVQADETDPASPDSDGDGLDDGDEDIDRDGRWDEDLGELDPRRSDTDGDGVPDGEELLADVCLRGVVGDFLEVTEVGAAFLAGSARVSVTSSDDVAALVADSGEVVIVGRNALPAVSIEAALEALAASESAGLRLALRSEQADRSRYVFEWTSPQRLDPAELAGLVADRALGVTLDTALLVAPAGEKFVIFVELEAREEGTVLAPRFSLSVSPAGRATHLAPSIDVVAPAVNASAQWQCGEARVAAPADELAVVVVWEASAAGIAALEAFAESLAQAISARGELGLASRVWLVSGSAHEDSGRSMVAITSADQLRRQVTAVAEGGLDQRLWFNALSAVEQVKEGGVAPALVVLATREDTEFRSGELNGRDGNPLGLALPEGEVRQLKTEYYARALSAAGVRVFALAPNVVCGAEAACEQRTPEHDVLELGTSHRDLAARTRGVYMDTGADSAFQVVEAAAADLFGSAGTLPGVSGLVTGTLAASTGAGVRTNLESPWRTTSVPLLPAEWNNVDAAFSYLYWAGPGADEGVAP